MKISSINTFRTENLKTKYQFGDSWTRTNNLAVNSRSL